MESKHEGLKYFAKHFLNPITVKIAGAKFSPFASIHHVGRKSGKRYATPLIVRRTRNGFVIALTYGPNVDWFKNITAAGQGSIRWNGHEYELAKPLAVPKEKGMGIFPLPARLILTRAGVTDFVLIPARAAD